MLGVAHTKPFSIVLLRKDLAQESENAVDNFMDIFSMTIAR